MYSYNGRGSVRCCVLLVAYGIETYYFLAIQKKIALFLSFLQKYLLGIWIFQKFFVSLHRI